jgi:hypothetical protein
LANPTGWRNGISGFTINQNREGGSGNAGFDKPDEMIIKANMSKCRFNESPFQPIKSFGQIKFDDKSMVFLGFKRKRMNKFLGDDNVRRNVPGLYEGCLRVVYVIR